MFPSCLSPSKVALAHRWPLFNEAWRKAARRRVAAIPGGVWQIEVFCVTTKQEAKQVLFAPTTKPPSPLTLRCLSPPWLCPGLSPLALPFLFSVPTRPSYKAASFPCRAVLVPGKKVGHRRQSGPGAVTLSEARHHPWLPASVGSGSPCGGADRHHSAIIRPVPAGRFVTSVVGF